MLPLRSTARPLTCIVMASLLLAAAPGRPRPRAPRFPVPLIGVDSGAASLAVADFNGDGRPDLATAGWAGISIFLRNGDGTFASPIRMLQDDHLGALVVADFDGDGRPDLALTNGPSFVCDGPFVPCRAVAGDVAILLGRGDGAFSLAGRFAAGYSPSAVAAGDFDGDGRADLAVASIPAYRCDAVPCALVPGEVSLLLGHGDGTFAPARSYLGGAYPAALTVADFDADARDDLAVIDPGGTRGCAVLPCASDPGGVTILTGRADGTLSPLPRFGSPGLSIAAADFDADGKPDLAVTGSDLAVFAGRGDGTFGPPLHLQAGALPISVIAGDLDGDTREDLVVANSASNDISVLLGDGHGGFAAEGRFGATNLPRTLALVDFDGDGRKDVIVGGGDAGSSLGSGAGVIAILLGRGNGSLAAPERFVTGDGPSAIALADFNGDGLEDIVVTTRMTFTCDASGCAKSPGVVSVLLGRGAGRFAQAIRSEAGDLPADLAVADFNGDGRPDLVVAVSSTLTCQMSGCTAGPGAIALLLGNGDGTFRSPALFRAGDFPSSVAVGDFNGDHKPDVVTVSPFTNCPQVPCSYPLDGEVSVLLGNGDGTLRSSARVDAGDGPLSVAAGDFDGDRKADLIVRAGSFPTPDAPGARILLGNGDGTFRTPAGLAAGIGVMALAIGDVNGDKKADLALAAAEQVFVLLGNGDGSFLPPVAWIAGGFPGSVAIGDLDHDGRPDIALASGGDVAVLPGNGDGTFGAALWFGAGGPTRALAIGRLDGGPWADIAVTTCAASLGRGPGFGGRPGPNPCSGPTGLSVLLNAPARAAGQE